MAPRTNGKKERRDGPGREKTRRLHPETKKSIWGVSLLGISVVLVLAYFNSAGPAGAAISKAINALFGWGYMVLPFTFALAGITLLASEQRLVGLTLAGGGFFLLSALGLLEIMVPTHGGWLGLVVGSLRMPFGGPAAGVIAALLSLIGVLIILNVPLKLTLPARRPIFPPPLPEPMPNIPETDGNGEEGVGEPETPEGIRPSIIQRIPILGKSKRAVQPKFANYVPPPIDLLKSSVEKPTTGDLRANANIIKRTLEGFGIPVEMGEIHIGPKVTRYTLKPAEGVKLSRITALHQDLSLALAAHPIRIEAPIPGKSLVGIEVPNRAAALVRLGSLMAYPEFQSSGALGFALGRDVTGDPIFPDIERMPHLLIAGATGAGKSIVIHSLLVSMLYKNSPSMLRLILIDPKRVELSAYEGLPHLIGSVITESKKSISVFRWAIQEMERRYELLQRAGSRDIKGYNARLRADSEKPGSAHDTEKESPLPYLVIVVDELADLMTSYGREVEGSIVRLAQMARATGIHLVLSTQRPSVEVITGLIKANITSRIALQVASQIDSRTILDTSGAEKLLGGGDLLFVSSDLSKPKRAQGSYLTEEEINKVADFIREHNEPIWDEAEEAAFENGGEAPDPWAEGDSSDDELLDEAIEVVTSAQKASASLLQRRLKVGYARAARLLDLMEERGIIGPGEGAKPREVFRERPLQ